MIPTTIDPTLYDLALILSPTEEPLKNIKVIITKE